MNDDLDALLARLTPEERARLGARLMAGDVVGDDKVGGDKISGDKVVDSQGTVNVDSQGRINGVAVGVNLGTIVYGRAPQDDERRTLVWYLDRLAAKLYRLPLRGLDEKLDQGKGISLPQVYVMLAISSRNIAFTQGTRAKVAAYFEDSDLRKSPKEPYHIDHALPTQTILGISREEHTEQGRRFSQMLSEVDRGQVGELERIVAWRPFLASEVITWHQRRQEQASQQIVLLGDPGSGKSTFVRHLAWALARRGLDQLSDATALFGWEDARRLLPIILPLRALAGQLATHGASAQTIYNALLAEIQSYNVGNANNLLSESLYRGAVLLLFDGLDEVPLEPIKDATADRRTTLRAVRDFTQLHSRATVVLTCRTRAFDQPLRAELGWPVEIIAPFTFGQVRYFVPAWYRELVHCGQLEPPQAERMGQQLLDTIIASPKKLRAMAESPLLLTMMALVLYNKGVLPRDRPQLYERILELLLGQWDKVRDGQSLAEAIGVSDWGSERIRPLIDQLSFEAHAGATSTDGRGRLARRDVRDALEHFFLQAGIHDDQAAAASVRCLDYFNHRSGLLVPDDAQDSYTFAHLTLQEHCAGRALALDPNAAALILRHRADDRWREPIMLGLGVAQQTNPALLDRVLSDLVDAEENGQPKPAERRQRDLIFAAEIGLDRDWGYLRTQRVNVDRLQRDLRRGFIELLNDKAQPLPVAERVHAAFLLGDLGDPRIPVTPAEWQRELKKAQAGDTTSYFCRVEAGTYTIGSAADDPDADESEQPQHTVTFDTPFWIARYPITTAQWQMRSAESGGKPSYAANDADLNRSNQPVVAVTWHMSNDFCAWLSKQLGMAVRMPTEQEWEAAARGDDAWRYPWGDNWIEDRAATEEDEEIRGARYTTPVGCYPAGAALCGVLDMAGNIWEWTASKWHSYPGANKAFEEEGYRTLRGGCWSNGRERVRCEARLRLNVTYNDRDIGFRVVVAPQLAE